MDSSSHSAIHLPDLIDRAAVETHFQPILSLRRQAVLGVEALSRGLDQHQQLITPHTLFAMAAAEGLTRELDQLCRLKALMAFVPLAQAQPDLILFLNHDMSTLDRDLSGSMSLPTLVQQLGIDPRTVAIELLEGQFQDTQLLRHIVDQYHAAGFLVALDDVGAEHSNLDRIVTVEPDILKVDRSLVTGIHQQYHQQQVFRALVKLSESIGGWTITEGVETADEAVTVLCLGGDIVQGYYFGRPHKIDAQLHYAAQHVTSTAARFKRQTMDNHLAGRRAQAQRSAVGKAIASQLSNTTHDAFGSLLQTLLGNYDQVESAWVLDMAGIQVTEAIESPHEVEVLYQKTVIFRLPSQGTDHTAKEYYFMLMDEQTESFETDPYIPSPSGKLCVTVSQRCHDRNHQPFILCLHLSVPMLMGSS